MYVSMQARYRFIFESHCWPPFQPAHFIAFTRYLLRTMSSAEKRSGVDSDEGTDRKRRRLELGATESGAMESLSSDALRTDVMEVSGVRQAQERVNSEILAEGNDEEGNENLEIDGASTNNSAHYPDQDFGVKSGADGLRRESSLENEGHEIIETRVLDDSDNCHVNDDRNVDVDEYDDEVSLMENEESEVEESSDHYRSGYSNILSRFEINNWRFIRWPIEHSQVSEESMQRKNETNTATAKILNPSLCKFCRVFFDTWSSVCDFFLKSHSYRVLVSAHYDTMSDLKKSASIGCHLCALFLSILHITYFRFQGSGNHLLLDQLKPYRIEIFDESPYSHERCEEMGNSLRISLKFWSIEDGIRSTKVAVAKMMIDKVSNSGRWSRQFQIDKNHGQKNSDELRLGCTEESAALAQAWLQECSSGHSACRQREEASILPTRLIKIDCQEIRLCISADENCSKYATLSHCWGKAEVLRLQRDNLQAFLERIPYDKLCKTFRDAIDIARVLGFSWLWIDSLCIIQGDSEDWSREASRMATVYGLSSLNIAATAALDGTIGCLFERDLKYTEMQKVEVKINHQKQVYTFVDRFLYRENIASAPLTRRAWAVQERILAPRTLHFTKSQLFWECRTNRACETFADTLPEAVCDDLFYLPEQELQSWSKIIKIYTRCSLTNENDRLIAISGVARQHQKKNGDKYFAGLWQSRIREQMCWYTYNKHRQHLKEKTSPAPSWSWAAVNQEVSFPRDRKMIHEAYIDVTKVDIALENVNDPFGGVKSGVLTLRSKSMITYEMKSPFSSYDMITIGKLSFDNFDTWWDSINCGLESYPTSILILPIGVFEDSGDTEIEGLLLIHTNQENGQYERVGHFRIPDPSIEYEPIRRAMNLSQDEQFKELGLLENGAALPSEKDYISTDVDEDGLTWYTISII